MSDTIYREDAIKAVKNSIADGWGRISHVDACQNIRCLPSADRPQGKWKAKSFHEFICDNCGFSFDMMKCDFLKNMKYCPNCGLRKGADNE